MAQYRSDTHKLDSGQVVTRYEVMMLSDRISPSGTMTDAFGRLRVSEPLTLFDSQQRYQDNGKFSTATSISGGTDIKIGYFQVAAGAGAQNVSFQDGLFRFQLERNSFTSTPTIFSIVATGDSTNNKAIASLDWQEIFQ